MTTNADQLQEAVNPRTEIHVIPALPGFKLLSPLVSGDKYDIVGICRQPIIAWRIETDVVKETGTEGIRVRSFCYPITSDRSVNADSSTDWAVEYPDGQCDVPFYCTCKDAADLLEFWQEEQAKRRRNAVTSS
jgi:hypothetical protein